MEHSAPQSVAQHWDVMWWVIVGLLALLSGVLHGAGVFLLHILRQTLDDMKGSIKELTQTISNQQQNHTACREGLLSRINEVDKLKVDWDTFNSHEHGPTTGKVQR